MTTSLLEMRARPRLALAVGAFYILTNVAGLSYEFLLRAGLLGLNPLQQAAVNGISAADYGLAITHHALLIGGAISLLRMRKSSLYLFVAALAAGISMAAGRAPWSALSAAGWCLDAAAAFYCWTLIRAEALA